MGLTNFITRIFRPPSADVLPNALAEYQSFNDALNASDTYQDPGVIEIVRRKTGLLRDRLGAGVVPVVSSRQTLQNMSVLQLTAGICAPVRVLELGASFFELDQLLPGLIDTWTVVETPRMAEAGRESFQNERLRFFDDLSAAAADSAAIDLLIAQGVLQYCSDPLVTLDSLLSLSFRYIYVTRTMVSTEGPPGGSIITRQVTNLSDHGPGAAPSDFSNRQSTQALTLVPLESISARIALSCRPLMLFEEGDETLSIGSRSVTTRLMGVLAAR